MVKYTFFLTYLLKDKKALTTIMKANLRFQTIAIELSKQPKKKKKK